MAEGKSTFSVEIDLETIKSFMDMIEQYKNVMDETNKIWKETLYTIQNVKSSTRNLNEGLKSAHREKPPTWTTQDRGPTVERDPKTGRYRPYSGQSWQWGPGTDRTGSGQFKSEWTKPPPKGSLSDLDRLPWGAAKGTGPSGQFNAEWAKMDTAFKRESLKIFPEQMKHFKDIRALVSMFSLGGGGPGGLGALGRLLGFAGGPVGIAAEAAGAIGGTIIERSTAFREEQAGAQKFSLEPYQKRAFANIMTKYLGPGGDESLFGGLVQATTTPGGLERIRNAEAIYGVQTTGKETRQEQADAALRAMRKMATTVPESDWRALIKGYGAENVFNIDAMERFKERGTTAEELNVDITRADRLAKLGPSKEDAKVLEDAAANWQESVLKFSAALDTLTAKITGIFVNPFGGPTLQDQEKSPTPGEAVPIPWGKWLQNFSPISSAHAGELTPDQLMMKQANMAIPGQDKVPQNIQEIRDTLVSIDDKDVLDTLTTSGINVGQGLPTGYGGAAGPLQVYHPGGLGEAGTPRGLDRGGGGGSISSRLSGKGGGTEGGGTEGFAPYTGTTTGYGAEIGKFPGLRADDPESMKKLQDYVNEAGIPLDVYKSPWCAAWVNAQLAHEGIKGSDGGKGVGVSSFYNWGHGEQPSEAHKGDVMIVEGGKHVGRFTGEIDPKTGKYGFYSGNAGLQPGEPGWKSIAPGRAQAGEVATEWVDPGGAVFRAANSDDIAKAKGGGGGGGATLGQDWDFSNLSTGEGRERFAAGVRNFNPVNVSADDPISKKYGATQGAWDVNHYGAKFPNYEAGVKAGMEWSLRKYNAGQKSVYDLVARTWPASGMGTPRTELIASGMAKSMGIDEHMDLQLDKPENMKKWIRALTAQEQGKEGADFIFGKGGINVSKAANADAIAKAAPNVNKDTGVAYPPPNVSSSSLPSKRYLTDMDTFQNMNKGQDINVFNKSGANVVMQSAQLGLASGSFNT